MAKKQGPVGVGRGRWLVGAGVLALAVTVAVLAYQWGTTPAIPPEGHPDPRLAYKGPYRNVRPDVKYVGDAACAWCHVEVAATYARHPMGRSLSPTPEARAGQPPTAGARFEALGRRLWVSHEGGKTYHHVAGLDGGEKLYEQVFEVTHVIGSGTRTFSYLAEKDGFVLQTPITYYTRNGSWGLSPGFSEEVIHGRGVGPACLQCHSNGIREAAGYQDRFEAGVFAGHAIGCERCHGPGEVHVRERERGDPVEAPHDTATVNPRRLPWRTRDAVCQQCHLQGKQRVLRAGRGWMDFRPGMPLEEFFNVFVTPDAGGQVRLVGHSEEMRQSLCWQRTEGDAKPGCITCHDPHVKPGPAERVGFFRERCVRCHEGAGKKGCSEPAAERSRKAPGDSCIDCHMPPREAKGISHVALSDHRVPRRPGDPSRRVPGPPAKDQLESYFADVFAAGDASLRRDLAVALANETRGMTPDMPGVAGMARGRLAMVEVAAMRDPADLPLWVALGKFRRLAGDDVGAASAYSHVLERDPRDPTALFAMAKLPGRVPPEAHLRRGVEAYPRSAQLRAALAAELALSGDWPGMAAQARAWIELAPGAARARAALCVALARQGKKEEARNELAVIRKLRPPDLAAIEELAKEALGR